MKIKLGSNHNVSEIMIGVLDVSNDLALYKNNAKIDHKTAHETFIIIVENLEIQYKFGSHCD